MADYIRHTAPVFYVQLAPDGRIMEASKYAESLVGRPLSSEYFQDLLVDFHSAVHLPSLFQETSQEHMLHIQTRSGLPQSLFFHFQSLGQTFLALGRLDAEELEGMRREVVSLNQELSNATRRLHKQKAQLERLNAEKNHFLGMAAHDLRKPIGLVLTYAELLLEECAGSMPSEHTGFLQTIHASSAFMKRIVDDFLDVSAIEAGKFDLDLQPAFVVDVLEQSLTLNRLQAQQKNIELQVQCEDKLPRVMMDASKIEQAITNLISNAVEHSPTDGRVGVSISCDEQFIIFSVRDSGPGIVVQEQERMFNPFEKTSVKKTGGEKSTGLGLLIARKIVEAHGGRIWIDSQTGEGACVAFSLPIKTE